jgi:hypothetical protein
MILASKIKAIQSKKNKKIIKKNSKIIGKSTNLLK